MYVVKANSYKKKLNTNQSIAILVQNHLVNIELIDTLPNDDDNDDAEDDKWHNNISILTKDDD